MPGHTSPQRASRAVTTDPGACSFTSLPESNSHLLSPSFSSSDSGASSPCASPHPSSCLSSPIPSAVPKSPSLSHVNPWRLVPSPPCSDDEAVSPSSSAPPSTPPQIFHPLSHESPAPLTHSPPYQHNENSPTHTDCNIQPVSPTLSDMDQLPNSPQSPVYDLTFTPPPLAPDSIYPRSSCSPRSPSPISPHYPSDLDADVDCTTQPYTSDTLSEPLRLSLHQLPLRNVIAEIPNLGETRSPSANEAALVSTLDDFLLAEENRHLKQAAALRSPMRSILILTTSVIRAEQWKRLLAARSSLRVAMHNPNKRRSHSKTSSILHLITSNDIIIAVARIACQAANRGLLDLRHILLMVIDAAEEVSNRAHCLAVLIRDHYRAPPERFRPRILAISRMIVPNAMRPPLEYNLMSRFVPLDTSCDAVWNSCYGKGVRSGQLDIEYLYFNQQRPNLSNGAAQVDHLANGLTGSESRRDAKIRSELDHLVEQVGLLGVTAYQECREKRRAQHRLTASRGFSKLSIPDPDNFIGLTNKALSLLNEIHQVWAASTRVDRLMTIVYAGRPVIACALCEVLRGLPVFKHLAARVILGVQSDTHGSGYDEFEDSLWQGEDTDDEEISSFAAYETNILFVASPFCEKWGAKLPLPPTPTVFRFDGSAANPELDGGGGRCRVVIFKDYEWKRDQPAPEKRSSDNPVEQNIAVDVSGGFVNEDQRSSVDKVGKNAVIGRSDSSDEDTQMKVENHEDKWVKTFAKKGRSRDRGSDRRRKEGAATKTHYYKPPMALLGPSTDTEEQCFLYKILLFEERPGSFMKLRDALKSGLEDFLLVLTKKLSEDDLILSLKDWLAGNSFNVSGFVKLKFEGCIMMTAKQVEMARIYTSSIFSLVMPGLQYDRFVWDGSSLEEQPDVEGSGVRFLRQYLVLPSKLGKNSVEVKEEDQISVNRVLEYDSIKDQSATKMVIQKYFEPINYVNIGSDIFCSSEVDWDATQKLNELQDPLRRDEQSRASEGLATNSLSNLEGKLLFSRLSGETLVISGHLQYHVSPLSALIRSRKFALSDDGTLLPHDDLMYVVNIVTSQKTMELQDNASILRFGGKQEKISEGKMNEMVSENALRNENKKIPSNSSASIPVKWSEEKKTLVRDNRVTGKKRKRNMRHSTRTFQFDCERNVQKKRAVWIGTVSYTSEMYFNKYAPDPIKVLDQPLLHACKPYVASLDNLRDVIRGTPVSHVCEKLVENGHDKRFLVPELGKVYPLSIGVLFLPSVLFLIEQHLSVCDMRDFFENKIGIRGDLSELIQAVTASSVNPSSNYERLELLGDSVLKLSCTVRLFTRFPHDSEGMMHNSRSFQVSNARLHRRGISLGIQTYIRLHQESKDDWRPPGTDLRGKAHSLTMKALADVIEALCGAYYLFGARADNWKSDIIEVFGSEKRGEESDEDVISVCDSSSDSSSDDSDTEGVQEDSTRTSGKPPVDTEEEKVKTEATLEMNNDVKIERENDVETHIDKSMNEEGKKPHILSALCVERGYVTGYKFLEACGILEGEEPSHSEVLLSAIHAMHAKDSVAPKEVCLSAFPYDVRFAKPEKPWEESFGALENTIGYKFKRRPLLMCALTHGSYVKANGLSGGEHENFQRLEFLGDAVADFCVVRYLYERYPDLGPGELSDLKSNVVSNEAFARTSVTLGLHKFLFHSSKTYKEEIEGFIGTVEQDLTHEGELGGHGAFKNKLGEVAAPKVLGDIFEAVLGAVFVDSGLQTSWKVCMRLLKDSLRINADPNRDDMHPCTELNDVVKRVWKLVSGPKFQIESAGGKLRNRKVATVTILGEIVGVGKGSTVKRAKLKAAVAALKCLRNEDTESEGNKLLRKLREKSLRLRVAEQRENQI